MLNTKRFSLKATEVESTWEEFEQLTFAYVRNKSEKSVENFVKKTEKSRNAGKIRKKNLKCEKKAEKVELPE